MQWKCYLTKELTMKNKFIPMEESRELFELGLIVKSTHWFNPNGVLLEKWIDLDDENVVTISSLIEYYDSVISDKIDAVTFEEAEEFFSEKHNMYSIPKPILGSKNGYDSFPIIGWDFDIIATLKDSDNSFYMGYPIGDWFTGTLDRLDPDDPDDKLSDYIEPLTLRQAKINGIKTMIEVVKNMKKDEKI